MAERLTSPQPPEFQFPAFDSASALSQEEAALARFLREAPLILARERGLNARSLSLLDAHARRLGLASEDAAAAVRLLRQDSDAAPSVATAPPQGVPTRGPSPPAPPGSRIAAAPPTSAPLPPPPPPEFAEEEAEFGAWLVCNARRIPDAVFRPYLEGRARSIAIEHFGVDPMRYEIVLDRTLAALGMKRFTVEEARGHLRRFLAQRLSQEAPIRQPDMQEFYRHGESWGFAAEETDDELFNVRRSLHRVDARDQAVSAKLAALVVGAVVITGGFLAMLFFFPEFADFGGGVVEPVEPVATTNGGSATGGGSGGPKPAAHDLPDWWSSSAAISHAQLARERPTAKWVADVVSSDPARRSAGYDAMGAEMAGGGVSPVVREATGQLYQELILTEPDSAAEEALRRAALAAIVPDPSVVGSGDAYAASFEALRTVCRALSQGEASADRTDRWKRALAATLKVSPEQLEEPEWQATCYSALAGQWLDRLATSDLPLADVLERRHMLESLAERQVGSLREVERLDAQFVRDYVLRKPEDWRSFERAIRSAVISPSADAQAAAIDLMEGTTSSELQNYLVDSLSSRYDLRGMDDPAELAANLREALGIASSGDFQRKRRLASLRTKAAPWIARERIDFNAPKNALADLEELSRLTTMAYALESELNYATFDDLAKPPERSEAEAIDGPRRAVGGGYRDFPGETLTIIQQNAAQLRNANNLAARARIDALRRITTYAADGSDVSYEVADAMIDYAAADLVNSVESRTVCDELDKVAGWPMVTLALVDSIGVWPDAPPEGNRLQLIQALLASDWEPPAKDWKASATDALLQKASERLAPFSGAPAPASPELDAIAADVTANLDVRRGLLAPGETAPSASLGDAYRQLAVAAMSRTESASPDSPALAEAKRLFPAVDRLAGADLQRAALYQRLAFRLLVERLIRERPKSAAEFARMAGEFDVADAESRDVLQQLLTGERATLLALMEGDQP